MSMCYIYAHIITHTHNLSLRTCTLTYIHHDLFAMKCTANKHTNKKKQQCVLKRAREVNVCVKWLRLARIPPRSAPAVSLSRRSAPAKCPETALFALRRKRAACKAALRHRRITAPRSPFSGILKLRSGERRRRYPLVFLCGIYFVSSKTFLRFIFFFYSDRRPATCPDGPSPLARVCISSFCMTCLGA